MPAPNPLLRRKRTTCHHKLIALATLALTALVTSLAASADPGNISGKEAEAQSVLAAINALDSDLNRAAEAYNAATLKLDRIEERIARNAKDLKIARSNLRLSQRALAQRVADLYTATDDQGALAVLLGATSLEDLVNRLDTQARVTDQNSRVLLSVTDAKRAFEDQRRELRHAYAAQSAIVAERAAQRQHIADRIAERKRLLASIRDEITKLKAAEHERQLAIANEARARLANNPPFSQTAANTVGVSGQTPESSVPPPARYGGVVAIAMRYLGVPYKWGGASPSTGFDCSGFTMYVYAQVGVSLPHYTGSQWAMGVPVSRDQLEPGDLVFFDGLGHEGIYIGNNQFIHAPHTGDVVKISSITGWYAATYMGARRIV
jgi:cell wall-associated NlpC family hydrolase